MSELDFSDRYGQRPMRWKGLAVVLLVVGGAWLTWAGLHHSRPDLTSTLVSFTIPSESTVSMRYSIDRRDPNSAVICTLVAHDFDKNVVGQIDDSIPAGTAHVDRITLIHTRSAAVSASISRCRASSQ
ncbi:MAG TPA: DUF4307 domain-containing protein [Candidatus Nanopelagicaceae bacterium]